GHALLLVALDVTHEPGDRRVDRENDVVLVGELAEPLGPRVVHPELALEVDLARGVATLAEKLDRLLGAVARRDPRAPEMELAHPTSLCRPIGRLRSLHAQGPKPDRSSRTGHRPPPCRSLARSRRDRGVEPRGRRSVHACRVRQGVLRRVDGGFARLALRGARLPRARPPPRRRTRSLSRTSSV